MSRRPPIFTRTDPLCPSTTLVRSLRTRLQHYLILVIMAQPVRVCARAAVGRSPAWLDIGAFPRVRSERAQHRRRMERPRPHLHVIGLQDDAAALPPEIGRAHV